MVAHKLEVEIATSGTLVNQFDKLYMAVIYSDIHKCTF